MAHGGKRIGSGRKPGVKIPKAADGDCAARLLEALNRPQGARDSYEIQQWRKLTEAQDLGICLRARVYLYDKRDGKAVQPLDFNRPIDIVIDLDSAVTRRAASNK